MLEQIERDCYELRRERGDEFQSEAEAVAGTNDGWQARVNWSFKFNFQQIPGIQQDPRVKHHAALTEFGPTAFDDGRGKSLGSQHANWHVHGKPRPAPSFGEDGHSAYDQALGLVPSNYQSEGRKWSRVQRDSRDGVGSVAIRHGRVFFGAVAQLFSYRRQKPVTACGGSLRLALTKLKMGCDDKWSQRGLNQLSVLLADTKVLP